MTGLPREELLRVPLDHIDRNPLQPRKRFTQESLQGLAQSIRAQGVVQPLVVRKHPTTPGRFELVAGERRWRAMQMLDYHEAPVLVKSIAEHELLEVALLENIQRENLTPIEEARGYQELLQLHGYTQEELSRKIGKDRSTIANLMRLLQLPEAVQNDLETGRLTIGHARALLALPSALLQLLFRKRMLRQEWSVRETEQRVKKELSRVHIDQNSSATKPAQRSHEYGSEHQLKLLEEELQQQLGTRVTIDFSGRGGQIRINYHSLEEFERLHSLLKSVSEHE